MYRRFTAKDAETILRYSEGAPTQYRTGASGHPGSRHLLLSNQDLLDRYERMSQGQVWGNGRRKQREFTLVTAFTSLADMIMAAELVLNADQTQAALTDFFANTPRGPGMRAEIAYRGGTAYNMRFAQGAEIVRVVPVQDLVMILDRVDDRPLGLQIQTFFGTLTGFGTSAHTPGNRATIYMADGQPHLSHIVPG